MPNYTSIHILKIENMNHSFKFCIGRKGLSFILFLLFAYAVQANSPEPWISLPGGTDVTILADQNRVQFPRQSKMQHDTAILYWNVDNV